MLRGRIAKGDISVCAFCRYRLSYRLVRTRHRSFASTPISRNDSSGSSSPRNTANNGRKFAPISTGDWGTPVFASAASSAKKDAQASSSSASSSTGSSPQPSADDFLSRHEREARQKLIARKLAQETAPPPSDNSDLEAQYIWNTKKQREIEVNIRKSTSSFRNQSHSELSKISIPPSSTRQEQRPGPTITYTGGGPGPRRRSLDGAAPSHRNSTPRETQATRSPLLPQRQNAPIAAQPASFSPAGYPRTGPFKLRAPGTPNNTIYPRTAPPSSTPSEKPAAATPSSTLSEKPAAATAQPGSTTNQPRATLSDDRQPRAGHRKSTPTAAAGAAVLSGWGSFAASPLKVSREESAPTRPATTSDSWGAFAKSPTKASTEEPAPAGASTSTNEWGLLTRKQADKPEKTDFWDILVRDKRSSRPGRGRDRWQDDDEEEGADYDEYVERRKMKAERKAQREAEQTGPPPIHLPELISIAALADGLKVKHDVFIDQLAELGFEGVTLDTLMAGETAALVAQEYGFEPTVEAGEAEDLKPRPPPEDPTSLPLRPPVVTIMGHVDHGKTTLLDYLRQSSVAAQEHGGITQHIGAFSVNLSSGKPITFLDTPGHAAFLTMRQRGANVTDIVVLVVAADDSVKPQTLEALRHARASKVPIIVAINKIDKEGASIDRVKHDLAAAGVEIEDFGGDVQVVCVSGKTGEGMEDLEENILTLSEILDHRAEIDGPAEGWILESSLKPIGKVATVLVKRGTLRPGDFIAAGVSWAKIRHLRNEAGVDIDEAPPGTPVEILGWRDLPAAGDQVLQASDERRAKHAVKYREGLRERERDAASHEAVSEERRRLYEKRAREKEGARSDEREAAQENNLADVENGIRMVNFMVKADVHGSVEAVCAAIQEIGNHEVQPHILRSAPGPVTESDVEHAAISNSTIINFATTTPGYIQRMAKQQDVRIIDHTVIYHLIDDVKADLSQHLAPNVSSRVLGEAEVLQVFPINIKGREYKNIAGCRVRNGLMSRGALYRIIRGGEQLFDGKLETLKQHKNDATEIRKGAECGIGFEEFQDLQVGDQIQAYEVVKTARSL
ncbi:initiation factor 2 [Xylariomycetidae sp. FL2044]|nr:initiation factor 2 [Xylariomycetidae sp. FL2044]